MSLIRNAMTQKYVLSCTEADGISTLRMSNFHPLFLIPQLDTLDHDELTGDAQEKKHGITSCYSLKN
jgi:hypothetical protein